MGEKYINKCGVVAALGFLPDQADAAKDVIYFNRS